MILRRLVLWLGLIGLTLAPVLVLVVYAVSRRWFFPAVLPREWSIEPLWEQLQNPRIHAALGQSVVIAVLVSVGSLLVAYPAARALELGQIRGRSLVYVGLFLPTVVPSVATGIGLNALFLRLGLSGTLWGVVLVHGVPVLPYAVFTMSGVFANFDQRFEQQARVLGAGLWYSWSRVTLPLVFPGIVVTVVLSFLISWSQYTLTLLIGSGRVQTLPIVLFATLSGGQYDDSAILALIFIIPLLVLIGLTSRYLASTATPMVNQ
jgi:putative spermidine/putrescine transport system permease protein